MPLCQVDACPCNAILPMRGNPETCIGCKHPIAVNLSNPKAQSILHICKMSADISHST